MYVGVSKNLGHGFRIGAAFPVGSQRSRSAGIKASQNSEFVKGCQSRLSFAFWQYALSHGICVSCKEMQAASGFLDGDALGPIEPQMAKFTECISLYRDTKSISQAQKERMLKAVYAIEKFLTENKGNSDLPNALIALMGAASASMALLGFAAFFLLFWWPYGTVILTPICGYLAWRCHKKIKPIKEQAILRCREATVHKLSEPFKVVLDLRKSR